MKKLSLFASIVVLCGFIETSGQSVYQQIKFKDALRPSLNLPLAYEAKVAEETILAKLKETGYKPEKNGNLFNKKNKQDGFYTFSGVELPELSNQKLDLYFRVDPISGNSDNRSSVSLMVSKGYENFVSPETDSATFSASEKFLNSFVGKTDVFHVNRQIEDQKKSITASEKKWKELRDKQEDANKKITQLESDIKNWQQEEVTQQQEVDKQRSLLKELETKRASVQP